jgi:hypothetical protein
MEQTINFSDSRSPQQTVSQYWITIMLVLHSTAINAFSDFIDSVLFAARKLGKS